MTRTRPARHRRICFRCRPCSGFLSTTLHGTVGYFSEGMPLAYLLATVIPVSGC